MTDAATLSAAASPADPAVDGFRAVQERQLAILGRLAEAGLEIALGLEAQAKGGPAVVDGDIAMAYSRVARAVRQTIMLQSRLIEALQDQDRTRVQRKAAARSSAARLIRGVIEDERANDAERAERLAREAAERLEREDFTELAARPFAEAVAQICRDLGLSPDWLDLAQQCAEAEADLLSPPGRPPDGRARPPPDTPAWTGSDVDVMWLDGQTF